MIAASEFALGDKIRRLKPRQNIASTQGSSGDSLLAMYFDI
jgi:hypothetical protein